MRLTKKRDRQAELAALREELRKPRWCERYRRRYDVAVYFGGFEESWPLVVFDRERDGVEIGRKYLLMDHNYDPRRFATYRNAAEEIVRHYEEWGSTPEWEIPLLPSDEVVTQ